MYKELENAIAEMTAPGQMFEITQVEVGGLPVKAWANAPGSLRDVWAMVAGHGDRDYLVYRDERWTYTQAVEKVNRIAHWLSANGVRQHDRVAIAMRNYPEWTLTCWAALSMGAVVVAINAWWVEEELGYGLQDCRPAVLVCDRERLERFGNIRDGFPDITPVAVRVDDPPAWARPWSEVLAAPPEMPEVAIHPDDDAFVYYTSGTTGFPKGAQLTHRGCTNNLMSLLFINMVQPAAIEAATGVAPAGPMTPDAPQMASIVATPLFHVTANNCLVQPVTVAGGKLVHMYKWDAGEALRLIEEERVTTFTGVPVMSRELVSHPDFARRDTSSLQSLGGGGAAVQPDLVEKIEQRGKGARPSQGYGLTEVCGMICALSGDFFVDKPGSAGVVMPIFDVKCVDEQGGELPLGEVGEVCVKGAQVIKGYLNRPEATAEAIVDGWLHTGDIGYLDDHNFLYLVDRAKDMVLRGGENIYSAEVEAAIFRHDGVAECAVFAVPDDRLGEEVGAAIYPARDAHPEAGDIREFCRAHLASFKVPRYIWILDKPLPRNASGKFLKKPLQDQLMVADAE